MNTPIVSAIVLFTILSVPRISDAIDVFDAPGPGYRQQIERAFPVPAQREPDIIMSGFFQIVTVVPTSFGTPTLPNPFPSDESPAASTSSPLHFSSRLRAFSEPIRLTIDNSQGTSTRIVLEDSK